MTMARPSTSASPGAGAAPPPRVALVEDDPILGESLAEHLQLEGFRVDWYRTASAGYCGIAAGGHDLLLSDVRLGDGHGRHLYERLQTDAPEHLPPAIFITAYADIDDAVALLKLGAADYLTKPVDPERLVARLREICRCPGCAPARDPSPMGVSPAMRELEARLQAIARYRDMPVLILGPTGVGKEVVARRLHELQGGTGRLVALNCAAVPEGLVETELFGQRRGAFTGAEHSRPGIFEQAAGGTLLLDEVGDMPEAMQAKLLRVLQDRAVTPVGGSEPIPVQARLVFATHRDLEADVAAGRFRKDLYYRIHVVSLRVPPLAERPDDILWLAEGFLDQHRRRYPAEPRQLSPAAREALLAHDWPGQVRELQHAIERACVFAAGPVLAPQDLFLERPPDGQAGASLSERLGASERAHLERALAANGWRITRTAEALGLSRKGLWQKMRRHGLQVPRTSGR